MIPAITLDSDLRARLNGLDQQVIVRDEKGNQVGLFLPIDHYKALLRTVPIPFSEAEIKTLRKAGGGGSLADFWNRLGVS
jgi:hypothetical protein